MKVDYITQKLVIFILISNNRENFINASFLGEIVGGMFKLGAGSIEALGTGVASGLNLFADPVDYVTSSAFKAVNPWSESGEATEGAEGEVNGITDPLLNSQDQAGPPAQGPPPDQQRFAGQQGFPPGQQGYPGGQQGFPRGPLPGQQGYPGGQQGFPPGPSPGQQGYPGQNQGFPDPRQGLPQGMPQRIPGPPQGYPGQQQGYPGGPQAPAFRSKNRPDKSKSEETSESSESSKTEEKSESENTDLGPDAEAD